MLWCRHLLPVYGSRDRSSGSLLGGSRLKPNRPLDITGLVFVLLGLAAYQIPGGFPVALTYWFIALLSFWGAMRVSMEWKAEGDE